MPEEFLEIRGAQVHNLKNIDLRLPHDHLVVVTGVSGSGKSSLVFDLIYAEGRRRYVESLSSYARQFLERMDRPAVDEVLGIAPTVAIRQKNTTRNPRSTVATVTEIYDFLRLLYARVGHTFCIDCGERVTSDGVDDVATKVHSLESRSRWYVLFPVRDRDIEESVYEFDERYSGYPSRLTARLAQLRDRGYTRLFQDERTFEFSTPESLLDLDLDRPFHVLVDRLAIGPDIRERVAEAVEICYRECRELRLQRASDANKILRFSSTFECSKCGRKHSRPEPRMFSFNTALGACARCSGAGQVNDFNLDLILSRPDLSLRRGAIWAWQGKYRAYKTRMLKAARAKRIPLDVPYGSLSPEHRRFIEEGGDGYGGIRGFLKDLSRRSWRPRVAAKLSRWRERRTCPECNGSRLSQEVLHVRIAGESIDRVLSLSLGDALRFFETIRFEGAEAEIAARLLEEIRSRLRFLNDVGLEYLTLDRRASTLSGGEAQRIQLASSLGSRLVGVCYVLDEPSIGLHCRDTHRLIRVLKQLRDLGNTVFVVEHDREMMRAADHIVDLGPGAGEHGGEVVFSGGLGQIASNGASLTGDYLLGRARIDPPRQRRNPAKARKLVFRGASKHNLKNIGFEIPLGLLTVVTGVSGSGKSTLMHEIVHRSLNSTGQYPLFSGKHGVVDAVTVTGAGHVENVLHVDQGLTDRTSRSVVVTYSGVFQHIRNLFANTREARQRLLSPSSFSFNMPQNRCGTCNGTGRQTIDMQFLADISLTCQDCDGKRYDNLALGVTYQGRNIHEVLQLTVSEAIRFFANHPHIPRKLEVLSEVGLGYLRLGQPATHLSGGEAQRLKLAQNMSRADAEGTLFLFDEPTTGLHFHDIRKLLQVFDRLADSGATLLVVEHNLEVIKCADWIIDLGPEGGDAGGDVVAMGPPEAIARCAASETGRFLRRELQ